MLERSVWEGKVTGRTQWCLVSPLGTKPVHREWIPLMGHDQMVERKVILHTMKDKDAVIAMLRAQGLSEESSAWALTGALPAKFEGTEPTWVRRISDELQKLGCKVTLEKGPFVLDGWRKATQDAIEHAYVAREKAIDAELSRLTDLWENR